MNITPIKLSVTTCYLLTTNDGYVLVDTGYEEDWENSSIRVVMSYLCKDLIRKGENDTTHGGGLLNKRIAFLIRQKQFYVSMILGKKLTKRKIL